MVGRTPEHTIESVRAFWDRNVCGEFYAPGESRGSREYFARMARERYRWHYHLPVFLDQVAASGGRVLEIGCGPGVDTVELVRRGVSLTGIDLAPAAVELSRQHLAGLGLEADIRLGNAEALQFPDESFDTVYSFGVLHHTPNLERAIAEVRRVLTHGGRAFIMLYSRYSLNQLVHISLQRGYEYSGDRGTDAPVTSVHSRAELVRLFESFESSIFRKRYLFGAGYIPLARFVPRRVNDLLGRFFGWHWLIEAVKA